LPPFIVAHHTRFFHEIKKVLRWNPALGKKISDEACMIEGGTYQPDAAGCAMKKKVLGEGAERMVHKFREYDVNGVFFGEYLVAKENRYITDHENDQKISLDERMSFHKAFLGTQFRAEEFAKRFNDSLAGYPGFENTARVTFLECCVFQVSDPFYDVIPVLVEKRLDPNQYTKYNNNSGWVNRHAAETNVLQAFSHFTYCQSGRKLLVCDLQGVVNMHTIPPTFELTDPAIHKASNKGNKRVYGPTDKGQQGMTAFFQTHVCNQFCKRLGLPSNS
jgi:hypothetical protein